jgi:hypothetical protein
VATSHFVKQNSFPTQIIVSRLSSLLLDFSLQALFAAQLSLLRPAICS